ncbi:uncharacterized protein PG986_006710 [Apiospora aurea]|uniref:Methyltransferase domain-containing protein n=1 Tax=Apiospora aurea TaxID=335848 RepID=A0ABR1QAJ2_9PEZI
MPPSYGTKDYWDARFQHEDNYEWLLPADSLNAVIRVALSSRHQSQGANGSCAPQILHIGCGSSDLSFQLRDLVASPRQVTNVDYSATAVQKCRQREAAALSATTPDGSGGGGGSDVGMRWETADLLDAESIARLAGGRVCQSGSPSSADGGEDGPFYFDVVADKSTCDAISITEDIPVRLPFISPRDAQKQTGNDDNDEKTERKTELVQPVPLLAVHMAVLTPPRTGRWCAISYSDDRFSFLDSDNVSGGGGGSKKVVGDEGVHGELLERGFPDPRRFWRVERRERVTVAPSGTTTGSGGHVVHQPEIAYWLWVLGRTEEVVL